MPRKPPRELSNEDKAVWDDVARRVTPLRRLTVEYGIIDQQRKDRETGRSDPEVKREMDATWREELRGRRALPQRSKRDHTADPSDDSARSPQPLDRKTSTRLKRGKLSPEARIDLHGMTQAEAFPALSGFIRRSHEAGHRLVLVITGKGKDRDRGGPIPERRGVLRHHVPQWLRSGGLNPLVLHISEAHFRHGGQGALYVYLRRNRSGRSNP